MEKIKTELFLQSIFNDPTARFREGQWEAIDALVNHRRKLLVVQRTGWGKSLVYFLSAKIFRERNMGLTLIISPLIALMRNQVFTAKRLGVIAETLNSTESRQEQNAVIARTLSNQVDCLLITPERLANDYFIHQVLLPIANRISLIVVDEAHCISDWGHDFRPDYKRIVQILRHLPPNTAVLGTTATANNRVIQDVQRQLGEIEISRGSLTRKSIALQTLVLPSKADRLAWLVHVIPTLPGVGIIYTLTIRDAEQVAAWLQLHNIDAKAYYSRVGSTEHDEFNHAYRESLEQQFLENKIKVLVATVALGMGYDKPDIHFVIHYQTPSSIVAYYQQVGRAGRDIDHALGILMFGGNNGDDDKINQYFRRQSFPSVEHVKQILKLLENEDGVSIFKIEEKTNLPRKTINNVLRFLSVENPAPVIEKIAPSHPQKKYKLWMRTAVPYHLDQMRITEFVRQREQEWIEIKDYVSNQNQCRMNYLQYALDDTKNNIIPCGKCDICRQQPVINTTIDPYKQSEAENFLTNHSVDTITLRTKVPAYVFLKEKWQGGDLPLNLRAEEGFVLSHAEDTLWGKIVTREKYNNYFSDELVLALVRMIQKNWHILSYRPTWVCCVPSHNNIHLVSNFAERVAQKLSLPFFNIVNKIRKNSPQKEHQNEINQCKNLDGVFTANVPTEVQNHPVLLIDDIIDSGWTLTVVAAKLRQAGSGPVYPIALTSIAINESS